MESIRPLEFFLLDNALIVILDGGIGKHIHLFPLIDESIPLRGFEKSVQKSKTAAKL